MSSEQSLDIFLSRLKSDLLQQTQPEVVESAIKADEERDYICTPAPNAIEWATKPEFLGIDSVYHHRREYQIIRDFYQLRCPLSTCNDQSDASRDCWDKGREYLQSENLLVFSKKYGEDICPSCGSTRSELVHDGLLTNFNQMHLICGMRSGKTSTAGIIGTYVEHRIINVGHSVVGGLPTYFNQLPKQPFEITFVASTDVQSADTIWARYISLRQNSPWIERYIKWLKIQEVAQQTPNGVKAWKYEEFTKYISNGALNLKLNSMNSSSGGMAGRTRIASFVDELARFENTDSARSSDEVYRVLENSLRTVRSCSSKKKKDLPWLGAMYSISSPISESDKAWRLLKDAPKIRNMYYGHYATWEFNPDQPREMFNDDFDKDPIGAMRDFGARPPTTASPLIVDPTRFRTLAIQNDLSPTATFERFIRQDKTCREYVSARVSTAQIMRNGQRYIAIDAGASFDQFAAACAHGEWVDTDGGRQLHTVFDWVYRLIPDGKPRREVWFDFVVDILDILCKYYYISNVEFDRWQSTYLIQQIRDRGIIADMKGTTADHFNKMLNDVAYGKVRMLPPLPTDSVSDPTLMSAQGVAFYELERLERTPDLKKVFNPSKGLRRGYNSDDVATVCVHVNNMVQSSVVAVDMGSSKSSVLKREMVGSAMHNRSDSGGMVMHLPVSNRGW